MIKKAYKKTFVLFFLISLIFVSLEAVRVAGKEAQNVNAIVHDLPSKSYVDGLLGLSFLRNFNLTLNFQEGFLEMQ